MDDSPPQRWGRWLAAGTLACLAILAIWYWQSYSRISPLPPEVIGPDNPAPVQLTALGYLPDDTNVMIGLHVRELLDNPHGREVLAAFGIAPNVEKSRLSLERLIGLPPEQLDHLVLGMQLEGGAVRMTLVLHTREPYSEASVVQRLGGGRPTEVNGRKLYAVPLRIPIIGTVTGTLWCVTDRTLVIGLKAEDLAAVPATPNADVGRFRGPLPELLREKLPAETVAWMAASADRWSNTFLPVLFGKVDPETRRAWEGLHSLAMGVRVEPEPRLTLTALCDDDDGAARLSSFLKRAPQFRQSHDGREVDAEVAISADNLRPLLQQLGLAKGR